MKSGEPSTTPSGPLATEELPACNSASPNLVCSDYKRTYKVDWGHK